MMRDIVVLVVVSALLGFALGIWAWTVSPSEWRCGLHKNAYYPFSVELSVRDK